MTAGAGQGAAAGVAAHSAVAPEAPAAAAGKVLAHRADGDLRGATPLLLLNGGFMSLAAWEPCAAPLAGALPLLRCDFRGQLLSPGPAHRDVGANADDVVRLLDHLGVPRVHLLGASFGGLVAMVLAARHPQRVASLVAVTVTDHADAAMRADADDMKGVVAAILAGGDPGSFHDRLVADVYSAAYREANAELLATRRRQVGFLSREWFAALDDLLTAVAGADVRPELAAIRCPTLVVAAGADRVTSPERGRAVAAAIPGAHFVEHPAAGHVLIAEDPGWLVAQVIAFLAALS